MKRFGAVRLWAGPCAITVGLMLSATGLLIPVPVAAEDTSEQQQLVDKARLTINAFRADPGMRALVRELGPEARALFIIPQFLRGAFVFGGAGGSGVLIVRDERTGNWSQPVFYNIGSASFGLQIGADVSEIIVVVRTNKGLQEFYGNDFKLGVGAGLAVGPEGQGASAHGIAADLIAYARKKGVFGGISLSGALVAVSNASNSAYYGKAVGPRDIVKVTGEVSNPRSLDLRHAAADLMK
jgi:lipid-binding SYLF domain-containing protein